MDEKKYSLNENPQAGMSYEDREQILTPLTVRTAEDWPLYHVFLKEDEGVVNNDDVEEAKDRLQRIIDQNPQVALDCDGKSAKEALDILTQAEEQIQKAA